MSSHDSPVFVPEDFYCPITGTLMEDPWSCPQGHTYEKGAITTWLQTKGNCPMTRVPLSLLDLSKNTAMKRSIESIRIKLTEDQLQKDSRISEEIQKPFQDALSGISLEMSKVPMSSTGTLVTIHMPEVSTRPPVDIVLCIDVSGSMGSEATLKSSSGETIGNGFSVLSLTVAAAKTIMATMNEHDHLSVVTYTNVAKVIVSHQECSPTNKKAIEVALDSLRPMYTTNIWDGLHKSMEILRQTAPKDRLQGVFLLTDGVPNVEPPRGHEGVLERYFTQNEFRCMINCYGFGYQLDSELLRTLSKMSGGDGFSYIPDASLLGNIFIHGISNFYTTALTNASLRITYEDGTEDTRTIDSLKYGQDCHLHLLLREGMGDIVGLTLTHGSRCLAGIAAGIDGIDGYTENPIVLKEQMFRLKACGLLETALEKQACGDKSYVPAMNSFIQDLEDGGDTRYLQNMLEDFKGQVKQALNMTTEGERDKWFDRWGKHYLRSLLGAHQREICNNFKDKGVSTYGGNLFETIRDEVSDIFDEMPPPKSDVVISRSRYNANMRGSSSPSSPPLTLASYNTSSGPCCASGSLVWVRDATDDMWKKPVEDLVKGDMVYTVDGIGYHSYSPIDCIVRTECPGGKANLVKIGDLRVTPYHPLMNDEGEWYFPSSVSSPEVQDCEAVYSFIVPDRRPMIVDGQVFSTWGHGLQGPVIGHDYFGSEKVIEDMKRFTTYDLGYVNLVPEMIQRGPTNNLICKIA
jgi:hypothetical protein